MNLIKSFTAATFLVVLAATHSATHAQQPPKLTGRWVSEAIEPTGPLYASRAFKFTDDRWSVAFRAYADAAGKVPLFTLNVGGVYVIGDVSSKVPDAFEGIFPATYRHITAESDSGIQMLASMGCTLKKGIETPLVNEGCGMVPGVMQAMGEYDLVASRDGKIFFGDRAGDLTKSRPDKLTPFALIPAR